MLKESVKAMSAVENWPCVLRATRESIVTTAIKMVDIKSKRNAAHLARTARRKVVRVLSSR
jgi:hypothetical protein